MWHPRERAALADALVVAGPGAPTRCAGWRTEHLAAHVVLRERDPLTAAGILLPPLAARTDRRTMALGDAAASPDGYARLVAQVRSGPPIGSPLRWAGDPAQLIELFVHAEDVRRGGDGGRPRTLPGGERVALWRALVRAAPLLYRRTLRTDGLVLLAPGLVARIGRAREQDVVLTGEVGELVLHGYGRTAVADVEVGGDPEAISRMLATTREI